MKQVKYGKVIAWGFVAVILFITLFPVAWMLKTAFSSNADLFTHYSSLLPPHWTLNNFRRVLGIASLKENQAGGGSGASINFWVYLKNSLAFTTTIVIFQVGFSVLAGYALARLKFSGRKGIFYLLMTGLLVPPMFSTIPNYGTIKSLHLLNTWPGLVAPFIFGTPFAVFYMRQFFLSFPKEIEEASELDGLSTMARIRMVVLPMSWPPIFTLSLIVGVTAWNEYLWPLIVGTNENMRVLTVGMGVFKAQNPSDAPDWGGLMASGTLTVIPVLIILILFGKKMVGSIQLTGSK